MAALDVITLSSQGGVANARQVIDAAISSGSTTLNSATAGFSAGDVGKNIVVAGAGAAGAPLRTTIATFVSATQVTLAAAAGTTVSTQGATFGSNCQTALQTALNALATAGGGTLVIDGHYFLGAGVFKDFNGLANSIRIIGTGSNSALYIALGSSDPAIRIANALDLIFHNLSFVGTPGVQTDAFQTVKLELSFVKFKNCGLYGLASTSAADGAIVMADRSYLELEENYIAGCTTNNAAGASVVTNRNWGGLTSKRNRYIDLGLFNGITHNKLAGLQISPLAWVRLESVNSNVTQENALTHGVARFEDDRMDEFALRCIVADPTTGVIPHLLVDGVRFNVPKFQNPLGCAIQAVEVENVEILRVYFGFVQQQQNAVILKSCTNVLIDRARNNQFATGLVADTITSLILRDSPYFNPANFTLTSVTNLSVINNDKGGIVPFAKSGVVSDADFAAPPPIGTLAVDTGSGSIYVKTLAVQGWARRGPAAAWAGWTPVISATSGTITSYTVNAAGYKIVEGDICHIHLDVTITNNGTGAVSVRATLPFASNQVQVIPGREQAQTGVTLMGQLTFTNLMTIQAYDNSYPGANGRRLIMTGSYRITP